LNPDLTDQWSARRFPSGKNAIFNRRGALRGRFTGSKAVSDYLYKDAIRGTEPFETDWVPTVYSLIRPEAFEQVGGLPENMYYWAEAVFCLRLKRAGYQIWTVPQSTIVHFEGQGGGPRPYKVKRWHIVDFHRGAYRFFVEQHRPQWLSPARFAAAALLTSRAAVLLAANKFSHLGRPQ
jgi:GT2 family glycosyltransferase